MNKKFAEILTQSKEQPPIPIPHNL
nr:hypothetical protein [Tanacetum cinerariifolium]